MKKINKNLGIPYAVGYILAGVVLLPLLIFAVNKLFFQGNDVEKNFEQYLQKSEEIKVYIPEMESMGGITKLPLDDPSRDRGYETYTEFLSRGRTGKIDIKFLKFFSKEYGKYFSIRLTDMGDDFNFKFSAIHGDKNVIVTVNRDDMKNLKMGTKSNPVPIFKVVGDGKSLMINNDLNGKTIYENLDITQKEYENSVYVHLKYVMTKEEFKERFEKNK